MLNVKTSSTLIEARSRLEKIPKLIDENSNNAEQLLLLIYAYYCHVIDNFVFSIENISENLADLDNVLIRWTRDFRSNTIHVLEGFKRETLRRSKKMITIIKKKFLPRLQRLGSLQKINKNFQHKLSQQEINRTFGNFFPHNKSLSNLLAAYLSDCQIIRTFLTEEHIIFLLSNISNRKVPHKLTEINKESHNELIQKLVVLHSEFLKIFDLTVKHKGEIEVSMQSFEKIDLIKFKKINESYSLKAIDGKRLQQTPSLELKELSPYKIIERTPKPSLAKSETASLEEILMAKRSSLPHLTGEIPRLKLAHTRSSSEIPEEKLKAAIRAHTILQEVLAIDKKMMSLKFKDKLTLKDQAKYKSAQIKIPRKFLLRNPSKTEREDIDKK